jgi:hypothetical protein
MIELIATSKSDPDVRGWMAAHYSAPDIATWPMAGCLGLRMVAVGNNRISTPRRILALAALLALTGCQAMCNWPLDTTHFPPSPQCGPQSDAVQYFRSALKGE